MSRPHRSTQLRVVKNRWLAAGIDPACASAAKRPSDAPSIAIAKAGRQSRAAQSHARHPVTGYVPPAWTVTSIRRANGKSS